MSDDGGGGYYGVVICLFAKVEGAAFGQICSEQCTARGKTTISRLPRPHSHALTHAHHEAISSTPNLAVGDCAGFDLKSGKKYKPRIVPATPVSMYSSFLYEPPVPISRFTPVPK